MGAAASEPFTSSEARIIDYASTARDDFLDIFLCAHCHFYCGDGGGLFNVPLIFRRPIATVNYVHLAFMTSWNPYDLFIPKTLWLRSEKRWLTLREILESEIGRFKYDAQYAEHGIEVVDNTPDEITALAIEMEERLCGTWQTTEEEEELQRRFWTIYRETNALYRDATVQTRRRIGAEFLRQHRELLDWEGAPLRVTC